jgi:adenylyl-sulfate kinase
VNDTSNFSGPHGLIVWFTGLSGAGKTTISCLVEKSLEDDGFRVLVLDGDDVRERLHRNLGFSRSDIIENNHLISQLCLDERSAQDVIMVPIISPYRTSRAAARERLSPGFIEVHVSADIPVLEQRDTKGLYARAKNREIDNLIGYSPGAPYEPPLDAEITLETGRATTDECARILYEAIIGKL